MPLQRTSVGIELGTHSIKVVQLRIGDKGAFPFYTPEPSPAFLAVGYIIGPKYGAITASGGFFGWLLLLPVVLFIMAGANPDFAAWISERLASGDYATLFSATTEEGAPFDGLKELYNVNIKKIAIGAMIVGAFYTLFKMRNSLITGIGRSTSLG